MSLEPLYLFRRVEFMALWPIFVLNIPIVQKISALVLLITLHAQPMANGMVLINFLGNQEYIKEFLCSNREEPKRACNGKCYLMQQLKEIQNGKEQEFPVVMHSKLEFLLTSFQEEQCDDISVIRAKGLFVPHENPYVFLFEKDIFHPPLV